MKKCSRCKRLRNFIFFSKNRAKHDGFRDSCKDCDKEMMRTFRATHKEYNREYKKKWNAANPDKHWASTKKWKEKKKSRECI